ncbi:MAG: purine-nucleoside phosphorylase, partial [Proteobacteria bacterium]|nr:purine-nucleoside phosphorylase [Pseudomonadota bacterium]
MLENSSNNNGRNINLENLPSPINKTVLYLERQLGKNSPGIIIVLGSGLGDVMADTKILREIPYSDIPGVPVSTVSGHKGVLVIAEYKNKTIGILRGRLHTYEGYTPDDVVRIIRSLALLGAHTAVVTNAAGSTSKKNGPGDIVILKDHINMNYQTPLISLEAKALGETFLDMSEPYNNKLRKKIISTAKINNIKLREGVYAWTKGPQYETAAEIKMLNKLGADVVGMSTV